VTRVSLRELGLRLLIAAFCWLTALYAFITSSPFAYQQFIRPRVFGWIGTFSAWHASMGWLWLALVVLYSWPDIRQTSRATASSVALVALAFVLVAWNALFPVLPALSDGAGTLYVGILGLTPLGMMTIVDHLRHATIFARRPHGSNDPASLDSRLFFAAVASSAYFTILYAAFASMAVSDAFEPDLIGIGLGLGFIWTLVDHLLIFLTAFLAFAFVGRIFQSNVGAQYVATAGIFVVAFWIAFIRLIGGAVGLHGFGANLAGVATSVTIVGVWAGWRVSRSIAPDSGADLLFGRRSVVDRAVLLGPALVAATAYVFLVAADRYDWDFVLLKIGVIAVWTVGFGAAYRMALDPPRRLGDATVATTCLIPLAIHLMVPISPEQQHTLDRYRVYNAAFRTADDVVRENPPSPSFDRYLKANTGFTDTTIVPIDIDFVTPIERATVEPKPLIFLFVIDSLRPDYLSPYNGRIQFTPNIEEFAAESVVLRNAFTRYGGTGLSMPAIWSGSALPHKQYVEPFDRMNALDKLLKVNGYRRLLTLDHITAELLGRDEGLEELDRGRPEMDLDFCKTLREIQAHLERSDTSSRPIFAHTRSLNLHMSKIRNGSVPPGESYPGLQAPYASRVHGMDTCFGSFVDRLKALGLYDRSLIVLTSDHGEMLGEDGRWGHSYYMTPEVIQIPLIIHVPSWMQGSNVDPEAVTFSTDITPTVYAALGYKPSASNDLMGSPLVGADSSVWMKRRQEPYVLAASYGAVYAVIRDNGRHLYIADAVNGREFEYERDAHGRWVDRKPTSVTRMVNQLQIRRYVDELGRLYGLNPEF
jgi:hypothetical protein